MVCSLKSPIQYASTSLRRALQLDVDRRTTPVGINLREPGTKEIFGEHSPKVTAGMHNAPGQLLKLVLSWRSHSELVINVIQTHLEPRFNRTASPLYVTEFESDEVEPH